jgi:two-component system, LytTR family, sensor kinase
MSRFIGDYRSMELYKKNIAFNISFWVPYFLYEWLSQAVFNCEWMRYFINASVIVPITFGAAWVTVHVLVRKYFLNGKKTAFWIGFGISVLFFILLRRLFNYYYTYPLYWPQNTTPLLWFPKILVEGVSTYLIVGLYAMFYFMRAWYDQQRKSEALKKDKIEAQLELLKSQVQPHFIFNTLNNIYSFSVQNNARTSEMIYRLSALLSYMLYDSKQQTIPLKKEIEYVNNYIELEKIRYGDRLDISMNIFDSIDHFYITPLLLLPLVENSFKHGICNIGTNWIRIDISVTDDWLSVKIENSYEPKVANAVNGNKGIGLDNVKKRLEILYHGRHEFKYMPDGHSFLTILKVKNLTNGLEPTCDHNNLPAIVASNTEKLPVQIKNVVNQ